MHNPFAKVSIVSLAGLEGIFQYFVEEVPLDEEEVRAHERLVTILKKELKPPETIETDVSSRTLGSHTIYVHGKDEAGFWGGFNSVTINVTEALVIYVSNIEMYLRILRVPLRYRAEAVVTIVDTHGNPVEGARVYGRWSGSVSGNVEGITDENGEVRFFSRWIGGRPTFTFTVDNVVKSGCIYNASLNVETSGTIRV